MSEPIDVGKLQIPVEMDLEPAFGARAKDQRRRLAEDAGVDTGNAFGRAYRKAFGKKQGDDSAKEFLAGAKLRFDRDMGDAKEALARGLTDRRTFDEAGKKAAKAYDDALLAEIKRRADAGKLDDKTFVALTSRLKLAGTRGGTQFGRGVQDASQRGLRGLVTAVRGLFLVQILGIMTRATGAMVRMWRQAGQALVSLVERGYQVDKVTQSFNRLAIAAGSVPDKVLTGLRRATRGMVTDMALMERANMAFQAGLPGTADQLEHLAYVSRRLADAQGRDATDAFNRMVNAIAKKERRLLDELGIIVSATDANKKYADQIGKNAKELTQAEKVQAFYNEVLAKADEKVKELGGETNDAGVTFAFLKTQIANALNETAELVAKSPTLARIMGDIATNTDKAGDAVDRYAAKFAAMVETALQVAEKLKGSWVAKALGWEVEKGAQLVGLGDIGQMYQQNYQAIRTRQAQEYLDREERVRQTADARRIRAETDVNALLKEREETAAKINQLTDKMVSGRPTAETLQQVKHLGELLAVIDARVNELKTATEPTDAELKKIESARKALEEQIRAYQALAPLREMGVSTTPEAPDSMEGKLQRIFQIDEQIRKIEEQIRAARGTAPAAINEVVGALQREKAELQANVQAVRDQWEHLDKVQAKVAEIVRTLGHMQRGAVRSDGGGFRTLTEVTDQLTTALTHAKEADEALQRAQLSGDRRKVAEATKRQAAAQKDVAAAAKAAYALVQAGVSQQVLSQTQANALLAQMIELLKAAGVDTADLGKTSESAWGDVAESLASAARGVLSVADALGAVDESGRKALQGLVDVADAASKIAANPGDVGAWIQGVGGVIGAVSSLFGDDPEAERLLEQHRQAMVDLKKALLSLRDAYLGNVSSEQLKSDQAFAERMVDVLSAYNGEVNPHIEKTQGQAALANQLGLGPMIDWGAKLTPEIERQIEAAAAALQTKFGEIDERYGTNLIELLNNGDWEGLLSAVSQLPAAIQDQLGKLGQFGDDVAGVIDRINFEFQALGKTDADAKLRAINEALKAAGHTAGDFQDELDKLATLDLSTEEGQKQRDAIIEAMVAQLNAGGADLGDFTVDELRDLITQWAEATGDGSGGVTAGGPGSTRLAVSITEVQANTMLALDTTRNYLLQQILARMGGPAPGIVAASASITPPSPASLGLSSALSQTMVDMRGLTLPPIQISAPASPADLAGWEAAGRRLQKGVADGLAGALTDALQGSGIDRARLQRAVGR